MNFEDFINIFKRIDGVKLTETKDGPFFVFYEILSRGVQEEIEYMVKNANETTSFEAKLTKVDSNLCKIFFSGVNLEAGLKALSDNLLLIIESQEEKLKKKYQELGIPDLSLVTIQQMVEELKKRKSLIFSLVWIENNERENISIEGSGNPTQLVGLLARGTHMVIEWADKNMQFFKDKD
jgi:hypothetical protein